MVGDTFIPEGAESDGFARFFTFAAFRTFVRNRLLRRFLSPGPRYSGLIPPSRDSVRFLTFARFRLSARFFTFLTFATLPAEWNQAYS